MSVQLALTMGAFAIAAVSLYFNFRQHRRANREQEARARFDVSVRTVDADEDGIRWTDANTTTQITRIAIGVKNKGRGREGGAMEFVAITPAQDGVHLEGWVKFGILPGVYIGEIGTVAIFARIHMKRLVRRLERLGQALA